MNILKYLQTKTKVDDGSITTAMYGMVLMVCVALTPRIARNYYRQGTRREWLHEPIDNRDTTVFKPYSKPIAFNQYALN